MHRRAFVGLALSPLAVALACGEAAPPPSAPTTVDAPPAALASSPASAPPPARPAVVGDAGNEDVYAARARAIQQAVDEGTSLLVDASTSPTGSARGLAAAHRPTRGPEARVGLGGVTVNGRGAPEEVLRVLRGAFPRFRSCHEKAMTTNPSLRAREEVTFDIDAAGRATNVRDVGSTLGAEEVACLVGVLGSLRYSLSDGGARTVRSPLLLAPLDD